MFLVSYAHFYLGTSYFFYFTIFFVLRDEGTTSSSSSLSFSTLKAIFPYLKMETYLGTGVSKCAFFNKSICSWSKMNVLESFKQRGHFQVLFLAEYIKDIKVLKSKHWAWVHSCPLTGVLIISQLKGSRSLIVILFI